MKRITTLLSLIMLMALLFSATLPAVAAWDGPPDPVPKKLTLFSMEKAVHLQLQDVDMCIHATSTAGIAISTSEVLTTCDNKNDQQPGEAFLLSPSMSKPQKTLPLFYGYLVRRYTGTGINYIRPPGNGFI